MTVHTVRRAQGLRRMSFRACEGGLCGPLQSPHSCYGTRNIWLNNMVCTWRRLRRHLHAPLLPLAFDLLVVLVALRAQGCSFKGSRIHRRHARCMVLAKAPKLCNGRCLRGAVLSATVSPGSGKHELPAMQALRDRLVQLTVAPFPARNSAPTYGVKMGPSHGLPKLALNAVQRTSVQIRDCATV